MNYISISDIWSKISKYAVPGALGVIMVYAAASTHMAEQSDGAEITGETPDYTELAWTETYDPYTPELKDIFFDRDSFTIREDAVPVLDENVRVLKSNPDTFVVIESYCDENEEMTTSLGAVRVDLVKAYIVGKGIEPDRIVTANKCNAYDMELQGNKVSIGLDSRVHFVSLDELDRDLALASNK
jgi:outer membrane protein OmpA-like peptidoglycan-associated protein